MRQRLVELYRRYLRGPGHPSKLRVLRGLERLLLAPGGDVFAVDRGLRMLLRREDVAEYELIRTGLYEPLTLEFIERNLPTEGVGLFAGVNFGLHVMVASRSVGARGRIIGVEPQPVALCKAMRNIELNALPPNITLVSGALGARQEVARMAEAPRENSGWASLVLRDPTGSPLHVQVTPLPMLLERLAVTRLDLMLLDVEGFELPVIDGMRGGPLPDLLVLEVHPVVLERTGESAARYFAAAEALGYECRDLHGAAAEPGSRLVENNLVCVRVGRGAPRWADHAEA